ESKDLSKDRARKPRREKHQPRNSMPVENPPARQSQIERCLACGSTDVAVTVEYHQYMDAGSTDFQDHTMSFSGRCYTCAARFDGSVTQYVGAGEYWDPPLRLKDTTHPKIA